MVNNNKTKGIALTIVVPEGVMLDSFVGFFSGLILGSATEQEWNNIKV